MSISETTEKNRKLVADYITAVGQKQFDKFSSFYHDDLEVHGPRNSFHSAQDYSAALKKLVTILLLNDIKKIFVEGNEACVIYDFVTDTPVGIVPSVEWMNIRDGKIASIRLIYDRHRWQEV